MRRIPLVRALFAALVTIVAAAPAAAVQSDLTIFIDFDNDPATGCNDFASGFMGYDQRVVTTVDTTTGPNAAMVTQIEGFDCSNTQVFFDGTDHPVGIGNGDLPGFNVVETYWPIPASLPPPPLHPCQNEQQRRCIRIGAFAQNANGGSDTLFTTDGTANGAPIQFFITGSVAEIPTLGQWGLLVLLLLLAGAATLKLRRRPRRALLTVALVLCAGGAAFALLGDLDGNTLDEWPIGFRVAHDPSATNDGDDIASLYARTDVPATQVYFRIDASLLFNTPPVVTTTAGSTPFTEDGGPVVVDGGVTVTDTDSPNLASATVTITNPQDGAAEILNATACAGLTVGGAGTATLTLTGSQPPATYQTCFQSVTYDNSSQNPTAAPSRVVRFVANDGSANSNNGDKTVTVAPGNDAPVVTPTAGNTTFTEDGGPVVVDAGITVTDVDSPNLASATVTITNVQDGAAEVLNATSCAGLTVGGAGTGALTISGAQPPATYQACFQSVTYDNTSQNPTTAPDRVIRFVANDGALNSNNGDKTVTIAPNPDAPVVTPSAGTTTFTEDGGPVVVDAGITVTDADDPNLASATVTITNVQDVGAEQLAAGACAGLVVGGAGTATLTITGAQPPATYQACFQTVTYNNTSQNPTDLPDRIIRFVANDGANNSNNGDKAVDVVPQNDAPVVTPSGGNTTFTENGGAVVVDGAITVTDVDSANLASATVTITNVQDGAAEQLAAGACAGLTVGGAGTSTLNISGSQPPATYQACLQSVTYNNTSPNPTDLPDRVVRFVVNDGALNSNNGDKTVDVVPVDNAPVVTPSGGNTTFTEDGGPVVVDGAITVTDIDSTNLASATVTITNVQDGAAEQLAAGACAGLTVGGAGTSALTISGSQPPATYQACFQSVTYNNTAQNPTDLPNRIVRFVANDGTNNSNNGDKAVDVVPQDDAPVVTPSGGNTTFTEDGGAVVVDGAITVTDVDSTNLASATVTITNPQDGAAEQLNATSCAGLTVGGGGTSTLTISGSQPVATYQTCFQSVTYNNTSQNPTDLPNRIVRFVANDGTSNSNNGDKAVDVVPVDDAPVVTPSGGSTTFTEDGGPVVVDGAITVTDADSTNLASATVTITNVQNGAAEQLAAGACAGLTVIGGGTSTLSISGSQPPATYQACFQTVTYNNTSQNPTDLPDRIVRFVVNDGTSNSNNGDKTVDVVPVNDGPVVTPSGGNTTFTEDGGAVVVDGAITVTDADSTNLASATVTITNVQDGAAEQLAAGACAGLTVGGAGTSTLTITGSQPPATYQSCFQSVTYNNTSQNPTDLPNRIVRFVANDGTTNSNNGDKNVDVVPQDDGPVVTPSGGITTFTEDGGAVVVDAAITVTDADSTNLASATVTITNVQNGAAEQLNATSCAGLTVGGAGTAALTISGSQPPATYQTCFQSVTYNNTSQNPTDLPNRIVRFVANDGTTNSNNGDKTVDVVPVNDPPVVTTTGGTTNFTEDAGAVVIDAGVTVSDVDTANLTSATVSIALPVGPPDGAFEQLNFTACAGLTVGGAGTATLNISGSQPVATYQTCLQSVTYNNLDQAPDAANRTISFQVNDGTDPSNVATKIVTVTPVNDPPVCTNTVNYATPGNTQLHVGTATTPGVAFWPDPVTVLTKCAPTDPDGPAAATVVAASGNSTNGGPFTIDANGNFHFVPATGSIAADTFGYQLTDTVTPSNQTVNIAVGPRVWYIHDVVDANNPGPGDTGRSNNPFDTIAEFNAATTNNGDFIYVFRGNTGATPHSGSISLLDGQKLWGQGIDLDLPGFPNVVTLTNHARIQSTAASTNTVNVTATAGNRQNVEIRGLDLSATGATSNAIDVTSSGGNLVGIRISEDIISGATSEGIDININSTGNSVLALHDNTVTATGNGVDVAETGTGTLAITTFDDNVVSGNTAGSGIRVATAVFDADLGTANLQPVAGGTTVIGASGNPVGTGLNEGGLWMTGITGALSYTDLDVFSSGFALALSGTGIFTGAAGTSIQVVAAPPDNTGTSTMVGNNGAAVAVDNATIDLRLAQITASPTTLSTSGVDFTTVAGQFRAPTGSSITKTAGIGRAFGIDNSAAGTTVLTAVYNGTINNSSATARSVVVNNADTGSTVTFSGAITDTGQGVSLTTNTGATVTFRGGLSLSTGGQPAFAATGGGTIEVCDENPCAPGATGALVNTITTSTGTALNVANTTISANNLEFRSISAGTPGSGPTNGILLNTTGASGGLKVKGTGGAGTGGTIRRCATGISLTSTRDVSLEDMQLNDFTDFAIRGSSVVNFTMDNTTINGVNGDNDATDDSSVRFTELTGSASVTNSSISGGHEDNFTVVNTTGTLNRITFDNVTIGANSNGFGSDGILVEGQNTAVTNVTVQNGDFTSSRGDHFQLNLLGTASADLIFSNNIITNAHPSVVSGGGGIRLTGGAAGSNTTATYNISNNVMRDSNGTAIGVTKGSGAGTFTGTISGNQIGVAATANSGSAAGSGISVILAETGSHTTTITGNTIRQFNNFGIIVQAGGTATVGSGSLKATVTGNTVTNPGTMIFAKNGFQLNSGTLPGETYQVCLTFGGAGAARNSLVGSGTDGGTDFRLRQRQSTTVRLPGYAGANNDDAAVVTFAQNNNNPAGAPSGSATNTVPTGGGWLGTGGGCP